ncbi:MAG: S-adenosylmethionine:tRNA ribosyltransferase-isomerase, partial [Vulcanimicrobiaceae bacterium]
MTAAYDFALPERLIAQTPASPRDASRLMAVQGDAIEHRRFRDLPEYLREGDVLVLNETRVIAARVFGTRTASGGTVELLLLRPSEAPRYDPHASRWLALAKPGRRLKEKQ